MDEQTPEKEPAQAFVSVTRQIKDDPLHVHGPFAFDFRNEMLIRMCVSCGTTWIASRDMTLGFTRVPDTQM